MSFVSVNLHSFCCSTRDLLFNRPRPRYRIRRHSCNQESKDEARDWGFVIADQVNHILGRCRRFIYYFYYHKGFQSVVWGKYPFSTRCGTRIWCCSSTWLLAATSRVCSWWWSSASRISGIYWTTCPFRLQFVVAVVSVVPSEEGIRYIVIIETILHLLRLDNIIYGTNMIKNAL